jgi:hypothetical protein
MATINYTGPDEFEGLVQLFDLEFELLEGTSGRATATAATPEDAVSLTEQALLDGGFSINNEDVYDVVYLTIDLNYLHIPDIYTSVIVGTTVLG